MTAIAELALDPAAERRSRVDRRSGVDAPHFADQDRRKVIFDRRDAINTVEQALAELARMESACRVADDAAVRAEATWTEAAAAYEKAEATWTQVRAERSRQRAALVKVQARLAQLRGA